MIGVNNNGSNKFTIYALNGSEIKSFTVNNSRNFFHSVYLDSIITYSSDLVEVHSIDSCSLIKSFKDEKESKDFYHGLVHNNKLYVGYNGGIKIFDWTTCKIINTIQNGYGCWDWNLVLWNNKYLLSSHDGYNNAITVYNIEQQKKESDIQLNGTTYWIDKARNSSTLVVHHCSKTISKVEIK